MADQDSPTSVVDATYPAAADSVATARASVARWLDTRSVDGMLADDVAIVVSEACTNAVLHGYPDRPVGSFRVVAENTNGTVRVTVTDDGCGMVPDPDSPGRGFGLPVIAALSDVLEFRPAGNGGGTIISAVLSAKGARSRPTG